MTNESSRTEHVSSAWDELAEQLDMCAAGDYAAGWGRKAFVEGDGAGFACAGYSGDGTLAIVADNWPLLKRRGIYEAALVHGLTGCKHNHSHWQLRVLTILFGLADRQKLLAAGSPLPGAGPFRVYRGVAGEGQARKVRGFSWTLSLDMACWFAMRYPFLKGPAVHTALLRADDVYCYVTDRHEDEMIGRPRSCRRLPLTLEELRQRQERLTEARRQANLAEIAAAKERVDAQNHPEP